MPPELKPTHRRTDCHLQEGQIADWQISMKVGFRLEE